MNKKLVKATTAAALVSTVVSPYATVMAQGMEVESQSETAIKEASSVEEAKKELEKATERNKKALAAQQAALDELNLAKEEREKATQKVQEAIAKAEAAKATAEALLAQKQTESKENLAALNTQYADAQKAQADALAYLAEQQKLLEAQVEIQEAANKKLEEAQANITVTEQEVAEKKGVLEKATAQYDSAVANVEKAKEEMEAVQNDINASQSAKEQAKQELAKAEEEKANAEAQVAGAEQAVKDATAAYEEAQKKVEEGTPEYEAAKAEEESARQSLESAKTVLAEKEAAKTAAEQALAEAQNLVVDAETGITEADKELAVANAAVAVANAQAGYDAALSAQNQAQSVYETAKTAFDKESETYTKLGDQLVATRFEMVNVLQKETTLKQEIEALNQKIEDLKQNMESQASILQGLKAKQAEAETAYTKAQDALKAAEAEKTNAETSVKDAELKVEQAKQDALTAQEKIKEGSLGFFAELGCQKAIDRIKEYSSDKYEMYWMFGDERDATSLENMKEALEYIKYCRDFLRTEQANGNINTNYPGDFKVSLDQIAAAQVGANISSVTHKHSGVVGDENLIWGMSMTPKDAYNSWYTEEKELYEKGETDPSKIGHYTNLRDSANNYSVIGIAIHDSVWNEDGTFKHSPTISQTFNTTEATGDSEDKFVYSVERYEELFMDYYNKLHAQLNGEEAAKKALEEAKAGLADAVKVVDTASEHVSTTKGKLDEVTMNTAGQQDVVDGLQAQLDQLNKELEQKNQELEAASAKEAEIAVRLTDLDKKVEESYQNREELRNQTNVAQKDLDEKTAATEAQKVILDEATDAYQKLAGEGNLPTKEEADQMLEDANAQKAEAEKALADAKAKEQEKLQALDAANTEVNHALNEVAAKQGIYTEKKENSQAIFRALVENRDQKKEALTASQNNLADAKNTLDGYVQAYKEAEAKYEKGSAELNAAYERMQAAQADYDFKLAAHNISKNVYETAKAGYEEAVAAILPLREAKAEYDKAVADRKAQEGKVEDAEKDIVAKEALATAIQKAMEAAKKDNAVLAGVTIDGLMEKPMTEEEYLYLNAYVEGYKKSLDEKAQADEDSTASIDRVTASEMKYVEAKKYATQTTADLLIAQDNYDKAVEADKEQNGGNNGSGNGGSGEQGGNQDNNQNGSGNTGNNGQSGNGNSQSENNNQSGTNQEGTNQNDSNQNDKSQNKPAETTPEKGNKAPKTADVSGIGMASFGLFSSATLAAMATMFKRKRRNDEE